MVLTVSSALFPATNSSCHRHRRIKVLRKPGWACKNLRRLDTSNGCQDHTALPSAATRLRQKASPGKAPFVSRALDRSRENPPCDIKPANAAASTASHPNVRDDHD